MRMTLTIAALLGAFCFGTITGCGGQAGKPVQGDKPAQAAKKKLTRDEFKALVEGKTKAEVIAAVGKPSSTQVGASGNETWRFEDLVTDPITNKLQDAILTFEKDSDKATSIRFF